MQEPARILIRATNWIGDAVMSLPAVRAVRSRFPHADIAILARPWVADLYARETCVNRIILYGPRSGFRDLGAKLAAAWALRRERFDCAILLQNAFEAAAVARLAGVRNVIGYDRDGRGWLLSQAIPVPRKGEIPDHERFYYLELLRRAGLFEVLPQSDAIRFEGAPEFADAGTRLFTDWDLPLPVIGLSPGAAYGTAKRWLPERFAQAAAILASEHQASVCLFGSSAERELCREIVTAIGRQVVVRNLAGQTSLKQFMEAAAACLLFLTNDSGAMHIASALGVPTVTVFGATNPVTTGPTGKRSRIVQEKVACSPCLLRECPIDHRCMTGVTAAHVVGVADELLSIG